MLAAAPVYAQQPARPDVPVVAPRGIKLTAEQEHVIKEIVLKDAAVKPVSANVPMGIGDTVPTDVPLQMFPELVTLKVPDVKSHAYFVKNDEVVIVSPQDRKIADVVK